MGTHWLAGFIALLVSMPAGQVMAADYAVPPGFEALMEPQETIGPYHALMLASSQNGSCSTC